MPVTWRREDYGYLAAALAAAVLLGYLLAGNFGLVPSPLAPHGAAADPPPDVADVQTAATGPGGEGAAIVPAVAPSPDTTTVPGLARSSSDTTAPEAHVLTASGLNIGLLERASVSGTATDTGSGVEEVVVNFYMSDRVYTVPAELTCADDGRLDCTWSAGVPQVLGTYQVVAYAVDSAGNVGASGPIRITTVNTGATLEGAVDTVEDVVEALPVILGDLVEAVPSALQSTVGTLVGLLSGRG